jgi:parallel beta-helix repeat protein
LYQARILDKDRTLKAILPGVRWHYNRRINEASDITIEIPQEVVDEHITYDDPLFGFLSATQPVMVDSAEVPPVDNKALYAQIAAYVQIYQEDILKASGVITDRQAGTNSVSISAKTEEIVLESNLTPAQYGKVWDGWDLADVARDLLQGWHTIRVKDKSQWQARIVSSSNIDLNTEPGIVLLAKSAFPFFGYYSSGSITLLFEESEIDQFVKWDRVRWYSDSNDTVYTSIQISYDGSTWSSEIDGGLPEEIGYALGGAQNQVYIKINLKTFDPTVTPRVFSLEVISRTDIGLSADSIPSTAGVTVSGLSADYANALRELIDACGQTGWEFSVWNGALSIAEKIGTDRTSQFMLREGTTMEITTLGEDDSELCNFLIAYGPGQGINRLEVPLKDQDSIDAYRPYKKAIEFPDVTTLEALQNAAQAYLDAHKTPITHLEVKAVFDYDNEPDYGLGDYVQVVIPKSGIITNTRIMTEARDYGDNGLSVTLNLGRPALTLQRVLEGPPPPKVVGPQKPTGVYAKGIPTGIRVSCAQPKGDWAYTECHVSTEQGFTPSPSTLADSGRKLIFDILKLTPNTLYYACLIHVDSHGRKSEPSIEVNAVSEYASTMVTVAAADTPIDRQMMADYICPGEHDDVLLNELFNSLSGEVLLLAGTYQISDTIIIQAESPLSAIRGEGDGTCLKVMDGSYLILPGIFYSLKKLHITNLRIDGNSGNVEPIDDWYPYIYFKNCVDPIVERVTIINSASEAIRFDYVEKGKITNCTIIKSVGSHMYSNILLNYCTGTVVNTNTLESVPGGLDLSDIGISSHASTEIVISNNTIKHFFYSIMVTYGSDIAVSANICSNGKFGIRLDYTTDNTITNNNCLGHLGSGISLINADRNVISNNILKNNRASNDYASQGQIELFDSDQNSIQGNTIRQDPDNPADYGVYIDTDSRDNIVTNNDLLDSGQTDIYAPPITQTILTPGNRLSS